MNRDLPEWKTLDGVGPNRAENLRTEIGTTEDFLEMSQELHPDLSPILCLDVISLKSVDGIGQELATDIVDQLVEDMQDAQ